MKLYRVNLSDPGAGQVVEWFSNKRDADRRLREWQRENGPDNGGHPEYIQPTEVPTDKAGLLRWLNNNFDLDNG